MPEPAEGFSSVAVGPATVIVRASCVVVLPSVSAHPPAVQTIVTWPVRYPVIALVKR
jgi:hypothetical protein